VERALGQLIRSFCEGTPSSCLYPTHLAVTDFIFSKADQYATGSVDEMQRKTVEYVHTRHSPDERLGGREATYQRDEVSGPLSGTYTGDEVPVNHGKVLKKKTVREETTEVLEEEGSPTASEANVSLLISLYTWLILFI
jgi:hypothetical protein